MSSQQKDMSKTALTGKNMLGNSKVQGEELFQLNKSCALQNRNFMEVLYNYGGFELTRHTFLWEPLHYVL